MLRLPFRLFSLLVLAAACAIPAAAQEQGRYFPLNQRLPPGVAGRWSVTIHRGMYGYAQPVRVALPTAGEVTFFDPDHVGGIVMPAPAQAGLLVGHVYRVRISGLPEFPGVELFPTIEMLDRLHPPEGRAADFPVPVEFTRSEIETALQGRMVTKVVYVEQPQLAAPFSQTDGVHVEELPASVNLLEAADRAGRPMLIVRLGGRIPDPRDPADDFFGTAAPIMVSQPSPKPYTP